MTRFATSPFRRYRQIFRTSCTFFTPRNDPYYYYYPEVLETLLFLQRKKATLPSKTRNLEEKIEVERRPLSHCTRPRLFAKFDPAPPSPMEDRDISITTCMYVGESSKSRREGSFPPCEFRLTLTIPRPYPFPQLEKGFRFDKSCKSCTICASETKERRRSFPGSKLSANSCYPPRNKILLSPS